MLVLSRKKRESVVIGAQDGIHRLLKVTVLEVGSDTVKLAFDADVPVQRLEEWERIRANGVMDRPIGDGGCG
jgi:carbon storage regulator CsrA